MNESIILISPAENLPFLMALHSWGLGVIRAIQSIASPGLTVFMKAVTSLGTEYVYMLVVMFFFWCVNEKKGFRLGLLIIFTTWVNLSLKGIFNQPRPYELEPALGMAFEPSRAFPSGHAQMSFTFWIALAIDLAKRKKFRPLIWGASVFLVLLIGFTRLYLGVHFPTDVLGGWIMGGLVLALFYVLDKQGTRILGQQSMRPQLITAAATALIMNALYPADSSLGAMILGFCAGYSLMLKGFPFSAQGELTGKKPGGVVLGLRLVLGLTGAVIIYLGLRFVLPGPDSILRGIPVLEGFYEVGRFIRYGLLGFWGSAGAPWVFRRLALSPSLPEEA